MRATRASQAGVTAIGFLFLAAAFGLLGYAGLKVVPLYMQKMRLATVLEDLEQELKTGGKSPAGIRTELEKRFEIEGVNIPRENVTIEQGRAGYNLRILYEARTPFISDLWFVVVFDEQVEIAR
jgi:hypothetical protein